MPPPLVSQTQPWARLPKIPAFFISMPGTLLTFPYVGNQNPPATPLSAIATAGPATEGVVAAKAQVTAAKTIRMQDRRTALRRASEFDSIHRWSFSLR